MIKTWHPGQCVISESMRVDWEIIKQMRGDKTVYHSIAKVGKVDIRRIVHVTDQAIMKAKHLSRGHDNG